MRKRTVCWLLVVALVLGVPAAAWAQVDYNGALQQLEAPERLFAMESMLPGDTGCRAVVLRNQSGDNLLFYLGAGAEPGQGEAAARLLEELELEVVFHGVDAAGRVDQQGTRIYRGPASGSGGLADGYVELGRLGARQQAVLQITLTLPTGLGSEHQGVLAEIGWRFACSVTGGDGGDGGGGGGGSGSTNDRNGGEYRDGAVAGAAGGLTVIPEGETPLGGLVEILDEEIPLEINPHTGVSAGFGIAPAVLLAAGVGLGVLLLPRGRGKRRRGS